MYESKKNEGDDDKSWGVRGRINLWAISHGYDVSRDIWALIIWFIPTHINFQRYFDVNPREIRWQQITEKPNQITRIDESHYQVKLQSRNKSHNVIALESGWDCSCEDHSFRKICCKHIHAVEISIKIHQKVQDDVIVSEIVFDSCKYCNSANIIKMGIRHNKQHSISRWKSNPPIMHN